ncbi:MAG: cell surface protein SprA [Flavobacteriales bacterium]
MNNISRTPAAIRLLFVSLLSAIVWLGYSHAAVHRVGYRQHTVLTDAHVIKLEADTTEEDTTETDPPIWPNEDPLNPTEDPGGIAVPLPDNIEYHVEYNPITGEYELVQTVGGQFDYRPRTTMTLDEYLDNGIEGNVYEYWKELQEEEDEANRDLSKIIKVKGDLFDNIFGGNEIEIRPQGSAELTFGLNISKTDNPRIPLRQRRLTTFDFDQKIQLNVVGNIGTRMKLGVNYNTESTFDFENQMKLEYTGDEDQIIQKIELGNVSLPLTGQLIQGSSSLFGGKVATKWGRMRNTTVFSQQKGERKEINIQGGAQTQNFDITADNYEANRHYFLSGWFRDRYDLAMSSLPVVGSGVNITRIEVWLVNLQSNTQDVRNVVAFADLGEAKAFMNDDLKDNSDNDLMNRGDISLTQQGNPSNVNNDIYLDCTEGTTPFSQQILGGSQATQAIAGNAEYNELHNGTHFEKVNNMRRLNASEYTFNSRLGFISLKQSLNNAEVLCVAYEYTSDGKTYQVGTISQDGFAAPQSLVLKLIKPSITRVKLDNGQPAQLWDNMMKNVYNLGAFGIAPENFRLDVWYNNPATGVNQNYIPRDPLNGKLLIQVLNLDRIDAQQMPYPDSFFDFIPNAATGGGLIDAQAGRIYFPVREPFGEHLEKKIRDGLTDQVQADLVVSQVVFQPLYDSTKTAAQILFPNLNRFRIKGQYQSSSGSEISLNALNIPQGSVQVTAGGIKLTEGVDYTVDYNLGRVRILNEGVMSSGQPIKVSVESNSLFNLQFKTLIGTRFDYTFSDNLTVGATLMNLRERPVTQKVNIGDDPVNNTTIGIDGAFQKESPFITRLVDGIPFIDTKAKSNISISGEAARIFPGHSKAVSKDGNAYVDDFEGSQSVIDLRSLNQWFLASTPQAQPQLFPEGSLDNDLTFNYNRAKTSWYVIDPLFFRQTNGLTPGYYSADANSAFNFWSDHRSREILEGEVFPNRQLPPGTPPNIATFDLTFRPEVRGPYNYDQPLGSAYSDGLNTDGSLANPESRWGGVQRALTTTDFEASNVEFIQFWLMDPFNEDAAEDGQTTGGDLYFNLGNVSEDVLRDANWSYENGFPSESNPTLPVDDTTSVWGIFPSTSNFNVVNAFDNSSGNYIAQDIGIDGLNSANEQSFFAQWLADVQGHLDPAAYSAYAADPSADDFEYFRSPEADAAQLGTLDRYRSFNSYEGNSNTTTPSGYPIAATTVPNSEDINQDLTLNSIESYFQYKVSLRPADLGPNNIGKNYITDTFETTRTVADNTQRTIRWYQFKIPVKEFDDRVGGIADFRSIRYIRMYMKGWNNEVTLRFARLELVRGEWRKYAGNLEAPAESFPSDPEPTLFNIAAVNIEENGNRDPIPYVVPPGIIREQDVASANLRSLNEQSLSFQVCNLNDGDARAAYRTVNFDMRQYGKVKMFAHAEALGNQTALSDKDLTVFVRLGSDFDQNYYEYEVPMYLTPWYTGDDEAIWPEVNNFEINLTDLQNLKANRPNTHPALLEYSVMQDGKRITVKGNPNLANVTILMIGVRNPLQEGNVFESTDDGLPKCAVIWVNELRMTDFNEKGGWAAIARMNATLADFGTVAVAGNISTPGWGQIEQRVQERQQQTILGLDANSTLQLGKFFPENWGVTLPMYVGYNEQVSTPKYSPLQPDLVMNDLPNVSKPLKTKSQDYTKRRSINFTNVRIAPKKEKEEGGEPDPGGKAGPGLPAKPGGDGGGDKEEKPHFYDLQNFSVTYAYNEIYHRDINIDWRMNKQYKGAFDYTYTNKPLEVKPFAKIPVVKNSKYLKWVKEFNFYTGLKSVGFHTEMNRTYENSRIRNNTLELTGVYSDLLIQTQAQKTWNWLRGYNVKYDLTKSLKFDYTANNTGLVGEPRGVIDKENTEWYDHYKDTVRQNIQQWGTTTTFNQNMSLSYKLPFDKFPLIDFINSDARYAATYRWDRAPFTQDSLGNTIQNTRQVQLNVQGNFETLYNKSTYLKDINQGKKDKKDDKKPKGKEDPSEKDAFGKDEEKDKEKKEEFDVLKGAIRFMMMVRNVSGSYTRNEGMLLPGYALKTKVLGMDENFDGPGWGFVAGQQNTDVWGNETGNNYALNAASKGWLISLPTLNTQYSESFSETWNYKINLEPIKSLKIELTANRTEGRNHTSFFRLDDETGEYVFDSPMETGNFTASVISWKTAFEKDDPDNAWNNPVFEQFLNNRMLFSDKLNQNTHGETAPLTNGYFAGWGPTSQDVVIPSFIAAYTGRAAGETPLNAFATKVQPNWSMTYDGLSKIPSIKKYFKQFSLRSSYKSTLTTSYISNLNYHENEFGLPDSLDQSAHRNYISRRQINSINISEQITPIGLDMTLKIKKKKVKDKYNEPQVKVEYKRDRTVALSLTNYQITETKSNSITLGLGYKINEVPNPFARKKGSKLPLVMLKNTTVNFRCDLTMRDNVTIIRKMVEEQSQPTAGQRLWSIKSSADMQVSEKLTIRAFYDHQLNKPKISTSFPTSNISTGIALRFSLNN